MTIGGMLSHYRILAKLGQGATGIVYLAEDIRLGRRVALKVIAPELVATDALRQRFRQEARIAASFAHPGIAAVYGIEEFEGSPLIALEYVEGENLRAEIDRGGIPPRIWIRTALELTDALEALHGRGVVHRDLKPENIVRCPNGGIKVLDLGLAGVRPISAEARDAHLTAEGAILGTVAYMSPEQIEGRETDRRSDIFSLRTLLYELACGSHPFQGPTPASTAVKILTAEPAPLSARRPRFPAEVDPILWKCMRKDPADRYPRVEDVKGDLQRLDLQAERPELSRSAGKSEPLQSDAGDGRWTPRWWWRFHQMFIAFLYCAMVYPIWVTRHQSRWGFSGFFLILICSVVAAILRGHLWFTATFYPALLDGQIRRLSPWLRGLDRIFVALLLAASFLLAPTETGIAVLLTVSAIASLLASIFIEPATRRAAFELGEAGQGESGGKR